MQQLNINLKLLYIYFYILDILDRKVDETTVTSTISFIDFQKIYKSSETARKLLQYNIGSFKGFQTLGQQRHQGKFCYVPS